MANRKTNLKIKTKYNRKWLIGEVAERAGFTRGDIDVLLDTLEEIFAEVIGRKETLSISGFFKMYLTTKRSGVMRMIKTGELRPYGESYYASFSGSKKLLRYLPELQGQREEFKEESEEDE